MPNKNVTLNDSKGNNAFPITTDEQVITAPDGTRTLKQDLAQIGTMQSKLNTIQEGANKYEHPSVHPPSIVEQDSNNRFVSDIEKARWTTFSANIVGNGVLTSFPVIHNKGTLSPNVTVYKVSDNTRLLPDIQVNNSNQVTISFIYPLLNNENLRVSVL